MRKFDDSLLVVKLKEGNILAFEILYEKYGGKLYNSISLISYDKSLAKDITQSTFLTIWEKRDILNPEKGFSAYLYAIARNLVYKETERLVLNNKFIDQKLKDADIFEDTTIENIDNTYIEDYINQLTEDLSEIPKRIFLLKKEDKLTTKEIASELGITERAVEAHFYRTLKYLKEKLREYITVFL